MDKLEFEIALLRKGITISELAAIIGCNRTTIYRKLSSGKFERTEIIKIRDALNLTDADVLRIFFNEHSYENATETEAKDDDA